MGFSEHDGGGTDSEVVVATSSGRLFHCGRIKEKIFYDPVGDVVFVTTLLL